MCAWRGWRGPQCGQNSVSDAGGGESFFKGHYVQLQKALTPEAGIDHEREGAHWRPWSKGAGLTEWSFGKGDWGC